MGPFLFWATAGEMPRTRACTGWFRMALYWAVSCFAAAPQVEAGRSADPSPVPMCTSRRTLCHIVNTEPSFAAHDALIVRVRLGSDSQILPRVNLTLGAGKPEAREPEARRTR